MVAAVRVGDTVARFGPPQPFARQEDTMAASDVSDVLDPSYKKPFTLLVAIGVTVISLLFGIAGIEKFVDGRIELKMAAQTKAQEEQGLKIQRIEEQFQTMRDTLSEIRADVRVLRARTEKSNSDK